jgi:alanyl-tRNA synthetase
MTTRRLYYDDSFQRDFSAEIVGCEPAPVGGDTGRTAPAWGVLLDATSFYPTSGGQPHDLGCITDGNGDAQVLDVIDEGETILHIIDRPLCQGRVEGHVNWARRFDHMQQHTGQHLLSAVFQERFGLPTVSFHVGAEICTIDLRGPEPREDVLEGTERAANLVIFEDRAVNVRYGTAEEFAERGVRKEVQRAGILRAIEIEGIDLQPCGGTHVKRTGQIGTVLVRRCTKMRQDWRVEFACGGRGARLARRGFALLRQAADALQSAPDDLAAAAQRAVNERDAHFKNARELLQRLAAVEAARAMGAAQSNGNGLRIVSQVLRDVPVEFLGAYAGELAKHERAVALLAHGESGQMFFASHPAAGKDMNALLKKVLEQNGGKGGGTAESARGKLAEPGKAQEAIDEAWRLGVG